MPSKERLKQIASLGSAKFRQKYGQFVVEGQKSVHELIHSSFDVLDVLVTSEFLSKNIKIDFPFEVIGNKDFEKISPFDTPSGILAVSKWKNFEEKDFSSLPNVTLALDGIRDPGNLGTIIRTADWFGIEHILLSKDCTDIYNHKAISSTMGSFTRVKWMYTDLQNWVYKFESYGFILGGSSIYQIQFKKPALLIIGSESKGISAELKKNIKNKVSIPSYGKAESLNAAIAAAIGMEYAAKQINGSLLKP